MTYMSWERRHRVTTVTPGKLDVFVVTLLDGKRVALDPVTEYDAALARAHAFHRDHPCQIKVLPMTGPEVRAFLGIELPTSPQPMDAAVRQEIIDTLLRVVGKSSDGDARTDAVAMLTEMREIAS